MLFLSFQLLANNPQDDYSKAVGNHYDTVWKVRIGRDVELLKKAELEERKKNLNIKQQLIIAQTQELVEKQKKLKEFEETINDYKNLIKQAQIDKKDPSKITINYDGSDITYSQLEAKISDKAKIIEKESQEISKKISSLNDQKIKHATELTDIEISKKEVESKIKKEQKKLDKQIEKSQKNTDSYKNKLNADAKNKLEFINKASAQPNADGIIKQASESQEFLKNIDESKTLNDQVKKYESEKSSREQEKQSVDELEGIRESSLQLREENHSRIVDLLNDAQDKKNGIDEKRKKLMEEFNIERENVRAKKALEESLSTKIKKSKDTQEKEQLNNELSAAKKSRLDSEQKISNIQLENHDLSTQSVALDTQIKKYQAKASIFKPVEKVVATLPSLTLPESISPTESDISLPSIVLSAPDERTSNQVSTEDAASELPPQPYIPEESNGVGEGAPSQGQSSASAPSSSPTPTPSPVVTDLDGNDKNVSRDPASAPDQTKDVQKVEEENAPAQQVVGNEEKAVAPEENKDTCKDEALSVIVALFKDDKKNMLAQQFEITALKTAILVRGHFNDKKGNTLEDFINQRQDAIRNDETIKRVQAVYSKYGLSNDLVKLDDFTKIQRKYNFHSMGQRLFNDDASKLYLLLSTDDSSSNPKFGMEDASIAWIAHKVQSSLNLKKGSIDYNKFNLSNQVNRFMGAEVAGGSDLSVKQIKDRLDKKQKNFEDELKAQLQTISEECKEKLGLLGEQCPAKELGVEAFAKIIIEINDENNQDAVKKLSKGFKLKFIAPSSHVKTKKNQPSQSKSKVSESKKPELIVGPVHKMPIDNTRVEKILYPIELGEE